MQLSGHAVQSQPTVVVDAIGQVRCLLDLGDERTGADGVDAASGEEENVSRRNLVTGQNICNGMVFNMLHIGFRGHGPGEAA